MIFHEDLIMTKHVGEKSENDLIGAAGSSAGIVSALQHYANPAAGKIFENSVYLNTNSSKAQNCN